MKRSPEKVTVLFFLLIGLLMLLLAIWKIVI